MSMSRTLRVVGVLLVLCVVAVVSVIHVCRQPVVVSGQGDVLAGGGERGCLLNCIDQLFLEEYAETYTAVPRAGFQFRRWANHCVNVPANECTVSFSSTWVEKLLGKTGAPLRAVFRPVENTGFTALFVGSDRLESFATGLEFHAHNAGFSDHSTKIFVLPADLAAPPASRDDSSQRAAIQAELASGEIELFGMSYSPDVPSTEAYWQWVDHALAHNPDTRFFISVPWSGDPGSLSSTEFEADYERTLGQTNALVARLRERYPGVDFYSVPTGRAAVELYRLYDAGDLTDVSALVGPTATAVFADAQGSPGKVLEELVRLVWLGAAYALDLAEYRYEPGAAPDLKSLAASVIAQHPFAYRAPPEVDTDTDGDGIVDRLDPNPTGRPNILLIVMDDLGYNDLAINNGNPAIHTPNLDEFARQGMRFTRHYASPVCGPARAALLTGLYPERLGFPAGRGISPQVVTLPERLRDEGYATWHVGKWHLGEFERTAWPDYQGFDHWFGFLNQSLLAGAHAGGELIPALPRYEAPWLMGDTEPGAFHEGHLTDILADRAIEALSQLHAARQNWFLNLWFYSPHSPIQPAARFAANYPDTDAGRYRALVHQLDDAIGRVLRHLDTLGAPDETIVVVVSDNGGTNREVDNNAPYVGKKLMLTEGGLRTPLLIRWPDGSMNGQLFDGLVGIGDLYPTLLAAIGAPVPEGLDSHSFFASLLQQQPLPARSRYWEMPSTNAWSVLSADGRWRLRQPYDPLDVGLAPLLHDLEADPSGGQTIQPLPQSRYQQMLADYRRWYRDVHTVDTTYVRDASGGGVLTGSDFLRTPGDGEYTFGIGVPDGFSGPLVQQGDIWTLERDGDTVTARFGQLILLRGMLQGGHGCQSVVLTGEFHRKHFVFASPDRIVLSLYIGGREMVAVNVPGTLEVEDTGIPTVIGDPGATSLPGSLPPPVVLNRRLDSFSTWTVEDFSAELCAGAASARASGHG